MIPRHPFSSPACPAVEWVLRWAGSGELFEEKKGKNRKGARWRAFFWSPQAPSLVLSLAKKMHAQAMTMPTSMNSQTLRYSLSE